MCNATVTSPASDAYCPATAPSARALCVGGCCASSGRCVSSACSLAGLGGEVQNVICNGLNAAGGVGYSAACAGLGCRLAVPGCATDLIGGSCVGTVVNLTAASGAAGSPGAALVGLPCLDVMPTTTAATTTSASSSNAHVSGLWTACNCALAVGTAPVGGGNSTSSPPSTATPASAAGGNSTFLLSPLRRIGRLVDKFESTNISTIVEAAFDVPFAIAGDVRAAVAAAESKVKALTLPKLPAANVTRALALIGRLVARSNETVDTGTTSDAVGAGGTMVGSPVAFLADVVRGASAVAAATNSTNPLGNLLGSLASKAGNATARPLVGLRNLVGAFLPGDAPAAQKADLLASVLSLLSAGNKALPAAELVGVVSKLVAVAAPEGSLADDVARIASGFKMPVNVTGLGAALTAAAAQGRAAATSAGVDLAATFRKLLERTNVSSLAESATAAGVWGLIYGAGAVTMGAEAVLVGSQVIKGFTSVFAPGAGRTATNTTSTSSNTTTSTGSSTSVLQGLLNSAANLVPFLQTSAAAGAAAAANASSATSSNFFNTFMALLNHASGTGAPSGSVQSVLTLDNLQKLAAAAGNIAPLLQALGANTTAPAPSAGGVTSSSTANVLLSLLTGVGAGSGSATGGVGAAVGAGGVSLATLGEALSVAGKLAPIIGALSSSVGTGDMTAFSQSVQSFLETL